MLYQLKYTNSRGEVLEFKPNENLFVNPTEVVVHGSFPYRLQTFEGFGEVGANIGTTKAPYQDGSTIVDRTLEERFPYLRFFIIAKDWDELSKYRRKAGRVFNPKLSGKFELRYGENVFVLNANPESVPVFGSEDMVGKSQLVSVNFIAPNPYWQTESITEEPTFEPLFHFPFEGEFEM